MSLFLKIFATIVVLLILVVGGAALYLFTIFDANDYKTEIQALVKQHTQLQLDIKGDLQLSVFPWLGLSVEDIAINTADGHLASAGYARVFAKFKPLLKGELEVDGIALRDLKLNLVKDANGRGNWEITPPTNKKTSKKTNSKAAASQANPANLPLAAFALGYLEIENAEVSYRDLTQSSFHQFQNLDFRVNDVSFNSSFPVSADFNYLNNNLTTPLQAHLTSKIDLNVDRQLLNFTDTVLDLDNTRIHADLEVQQLLQAPLVEGRLKLLELIPANWAKLLQQPALADIRSRLDLQTNLKLDTAKQTLRLDNLSLTSANLQLTGNVSATQINSAPDYKSTLTLSNTNLRALLPELGIEPPATADSQALSSLTGQLDFQGNSQQLSLPKIALQLDDSKLQGNLKLTSFKNLASSFTLYIDTLNLDRYLPADTNDTSGNSQNTPVPGNTSAALLLPLAALRDLNTSGRLRIGKLIGSGQQIDNLDARVAAHNGFINLKSLTGNLYGGSMKANASIDARSNTPQISVNNTFSGVQAAPMLTSLAEIDYLEGSLDLQLKVTAYGNSLPAIKRSLTGEAEFSLTDGLLKNTNIDQLICKGVARARSRQYISEDASKDTVLQRFDGHTNIVKGIMQTDHLLLALNNARITGNGIVNLPEETLDYRIRARIQGNLENQACEVHPRYREVDWPIRCQGALTDAPSDMCKLDQSQLNKVIAQLATKEIQRKAGKEIDRALKDKLGDETAKQLKDLLGL